MAAKFQALQHPLGQTLYEYTSLVGLQNGDINSKVLQFYLLVINKLAFKYIHIHN